MTRTPPTLTLDATIEWGVIVRYLEDQNQATRIRVSHHRSRTMPKTVAHYSMDDATFAHLTAWCDNQYPDEPGLRDEMVAHLESIPAEDAEYSMNHGWMHVRGLIR